MGDCAPVRRKVDENRGGLSAIYLIQGLWRMGCGANGPFTFVHAVQGLFLQVGEKQIKCLLKS